jgi:AmiR/NasT family two-component response regulator
MASIPMMVKNEVIGVLNVYTNKYYEFTTSEITLLSTIANQAAVAIEKTELIVKTKIIQEELDTRKKIERAKGILMGERNINENEAFVLIRKSSMDKRISMKEIAEAIILSDEIRQIK